MASSLGVAEHTSRCMVLTLRREEGVYAPPSMKATVCSGSWKPSSVLLGAASSSPPLRSSSRSLWRCSTRPLTVRHSVRSYHLVWWIGHHFPGSGPVGAGALAGGEPLLEPEP